MKYDDLKEFMICWTKDELEALYDDKKRGFDVSDRAIRSVMTLRKVIENDLV